jgi:hypothetical protein
MVAVFWRPGPFKDIDRQARPATVWSCARHTRWALWAVVPLPDSIPEFGFSCDGGLVLCGPASKQAAADGCRSEFPEEIGRLLGVGSALVELGHGRMVAKAREADRG